MTWLVAVVLAAASPDAGAPVQPAPEVAEAEAAVLAEPVPTGAPAARDPWDFRSAPKYLELVEGRFPLSDAEKKTLYGEGFVVAARFRQANFPAALHELHTSQLPLFVSTGAILHAVFRSHDEFVLSLELRSLAPRLVEVLRRMQRVLPEARKQWPKQTGEDLDFYLSMARLIAVDPEVKPDATERDWLQRVQRAKSVDTLSLFGRKRSVDFTQFQPRGHYADARNGLESYFRLVIWLSHIELNLKSNACASSHPGPGASTDETPREVLDALALAELVERSGTGPDLEALDQGFAMLAGRREDVTVSQLSTLRKEAEVKSLTEPGAAEKIVARIGDRFTRTVNLHPMPAGVVVRPLPVIATLLGARITADAEALPALTFEMDPVGWAAIAGHARARDFLAPAANPAAERRRTEALDAASARMAGAHLGDDLYARWLAAVLAHAAGPKGVQPSFTEHPAWRDLRLDTGLVAFAQLRHDYTLYAAQPEEEGGCQIPEGYVEPDVEVYAALDGYAKAGLHAVDAFERLFPRELGTAREHFTRLSTVMRVLAALSRRELANQPLTATDQRFLSLFAETWAVKQTYLHTASADHDGWYYDLFYGGAGLLPDQADSEFIVDLHGQAQRVAYAGARAPELGFFVVDTGGPPRLMVGPVPRGFQYWGDRRGRLTDNEVVDDDAEKRFVDAPWSASYRPKVPPHRLYFAREPDDPPGSNRWEAVFTITRGAAALRPVRPVLYPDQQGPGAVDWKRQRLEKPVVFRLRGEHGELLLEQKVQPPRARFDVPKELAEKARLIEAEANGEVVEEWLRP